METVVATDNQSLFEAAIIDIQNTNYSDAKIKLEKILAELPENENVLSLLVDVYLQNKEDKIKCLQTLRSLTLKNNFAFAALRDLRNILYAEPTIDEYEEYMLHILDYMTIANTLFANKLYAYFSNKGLNVKLTKNKLFLTTIKRMILPYMDIEIFLLNQRQQHLYAIIHQDDENFNLNFIISLAHNSFANEFVLFQDDNSINKVMNLLKTVSIAIENRHIDYFHKAAFFMACCYMPISSIIACYPNIELLYDLDPDFKEIFAFQIGNMNLEQQIKESIKQITPLKNNVSKAIRDQYEEYPYPRWTYTELGFPLSLTEFLNSRLYINEKFLNNKIPDAPEILIAGCGTGSHPITLSCIKNSKITAIDLSKSSLAYAIRQTNLFNIKNIEYYQADISMLDKYNKTFDYIESIGVLHHMKDIDEALGFLVKKLKKNCFMRLGLYSEAARAELLFARNLLSSNNFTSDIRDVRRARMFLLENKNTYPGIDLMSTINTFQDFFSTSMVVDLLFNANENLTTIPKIKKMLKKHKLEFCGFSINNSYRDKVMAAYLNAYPDDPSCLNLDNWHQFELQDPSIFREMYQFTVKKK